MWGYNEDTVGPAKASTLLQAYQPRGISLLGRCGFRGISLSYKAINWKWNGPEKKKLSTNRSKVNNGYVILIAIRT
jgi:hypothetical protein